MRPQTFEVKTQKCSVCGQRKPIGPDDWLELASGGYFAVCRECTDRRTKKKGFYIKGEGLVKLSQHSVLANQIHYTKYMSTERGE